jgi:hypothetical protein
MASIVVVVLLMAIVDKQKPKILRAGPVSVEFTPDIPAVEPKIPEDRGHSEQGGTALGGQDRGQATSDGRATQTMIPSGQGTSLIYSFKAGDAVPMNQLGPVFVEYCTLENDKCRALRQDLDLLAQQYSKTFQMCIYMATEQEALSFQPKLPPQRKDLPFWAVCDAGKCRYMGHFDNVWDLKDSMLAETRTWLHFHPHATR